MSDPDQMRSNLCSLVDDVDVVEEVATVKGRRLASHQREKA